MKNQAVPNWAAQVGIDTLSDLTIFAHTHLLSMRGLALLHDLSAIDNRILGDLSVIGSERAAKVFPSWDPDLLRKSAISGTQLFGTLLEKEVARDFPTLRAYAFIYFWGALEHFIDDLAQAWLENEPSAMHLAAVQSLSLQFATRRDLDQDERLPFIIDRLERQVDARLKKGVARFEAQLTPFGLAGPVDDRTSRHMLELHQIRNVIVHNKGTVDRRLTEVCPWLGLAVGEKIYVDLESYRLCYYAVHEYVGLVLDRVSAFYGISTRRLSLWQSYDALETAE